MYNIGIVNLVTDHIFMKKTAFFSSALALMIVLVGTSTAEASTRYTYYPVATNYYDTYRNCTPRNSDLGLGGGVFVSGTTVCPTPVIRYREEYSFNNNDYYDNQNNDSHYYEDDSYDDSEYDEDEDSHYEEDQDSGYDESGYDEDEDSNDGDHDNGGDGDNNSGGSGNNW